ncbi:MAG: iron ABC transporter permease, partial [Chloroflexi bacterium]|nr:iron ABC transporter permease [Chloroflexota bacterium]
MPRPPVSSTPSGARPPSACGCSSSTRAPSSRPSPRACAQASRSTSPSSLPFCAGPAPPRSRWYANLCATSRGAVRARLRGAAALASLARSLDAGRPPLALWLPAFALALLCLVAPIYLALRAAEAPGAALDAVLTRPTFTLLARSLALAAVTTALALALALPLAWLTTRTDVPGRPVLAVLVALPLAIPSYVAALVAVSALGPRGLLQQVLEPWGVDRLPSIYGLSGTAAVLALATYPYLVLTLRPALLALDPRLDELSRSFGRGRLQTLHRVTLPQLRPAIASGSLLVALYALADFGAPSLMRFDSFTRVIFMRYQSSFERTEAAALALLLGTLALTLVAAELATRGRTRYDSAHGARRPPPPARLGR